MYTRKKTCQKAYQSETELFEVDRMVSQTQDSHHKQLPSQIPEVQTHYWEQVPLLLLPQETQCYKVLPCKYKY